MTDLSLSDRLTRRDRLARNGKAPTYRRRFWLDEPPVISAKAGDLVYLVRLDRGGTIEVAATFEAALQAVADYAAWDRLPERPNDTAFSESGAFYLEYLREWGGTAKPTPAVFVIEPIRVKGLDA